MDQATQLIQSEHRQVEDLFARFEETGDRRTAMDICDLLERHTEMEEQVLYPQLRRVDADLYEDAQEEHDEAAQLIEQIRTAHGDRLTELVLELEGEIEHHVEDEETEDLPAMVASCGADRMDQLGQEMEQWRSSRGGGGAGAGAGGRDTTAVPDGTSVSHSAPDDVVAGPAAAADGATKDELLDLTKDELYDKAKEAEIPGRSSMMKEELAEELAGR